MPSLFVLFSKFQRVEDSARHSYVVEVQMLTYGTKAARDSKSGAYLFLPDGPAQVYVDGICLEFQLALLHLLL